MTGHVTLDPEGRGNDCLTEEQPRNKRLKVMWLCLAGVCGAGKTHGPNVRLQEAGQEASEEEKWREAGPPGEAASGEGQQPLHREPGLRLRQQDPPVPGHEPHEWRRPQVSHLRGRGAGHPHGARHLLRGPDNHRDPPTALHGHRVPGHEARERAAGRQRTVSAVGPRIGRGAAQRQNDLPEG